MWVEPNNKATQRKRWENYIINEYIYSFVLISGIFISILLSHLLPSITAKQILIFIGACFLLSNYLLLPSLTGKSLAMFITKTKIIRVDGTKIHIQDIVIREIAEFFVPFQNISLFFSQKPTMIEDYLSKTRVIYEGDMQKLEHDQGTSAIYPSLSKPSDRKRFIILLIVLGIVIVLFLWARSTFT